jgi:NAD-dependent deacetylase
MTPNIVVLTRVGVSAESRLRPFRDKGGLGVRFDPMNLARPEAFARDPSAVLAFYDARRRNFLASAPNPTRFAFAELKAGLVARWAFDFGDAEHRRSARARRLAPGLAHIR